MSKSNVTENDFIKFIALGTAMPSYGSNLYMHLHTSDPGEGGTSSSNEVAYTSYIRVSVSRDANGWTVCDADGTPNANGSAFKNTTEITFPECTGVSDDFDVTHGSICTISGQILYSGALTAQIKVTNLHTPRFPVGTVIFKED